MVVLVYTPAHKGGVSANAYADAAAKAHLQGTPAEPQLRHVSTRLCAYVVDGWRLPADRPVYRMMHQRAMRFYGGGGQHAAAERHGEGQGGELLGEEAPQTGVVLVAEHLLRRNVLEMEKQKFPRSDVGI